MPLLEAVLGVAKAAGGVAKQCRAEESLRTLLVQTKQGDQANPRFSQDFKTLADVLIQQMVVKRLSLQFPELRGRIYGEESNSFTNSLGDSVTVRVQDSEEDTARLLLAVLDGNREAATLLAAAAHRGEDEDEDEDKDKDGGDINKRISECLDLEIPVEELAVWIDPIDSTSEYIHGEQDSRAVGRIRLSGLQCVTVLIGVYDVASGSPVMGVINQPFYNRSEGRCLWGVSHGDKKIFFNPEREEGGAAEEEVICTSSSEDEDVKRRLREGGYSCVEAAGAGYKLLMVVLGHARAYVLSRPTTYRWDTCGPHAVLASLGGGIVDYRAALALSAPAPNPETCQISYSDHPSSHSEHDKSIDKWCNRGGIIAYRDKTVLNKVIQLLSD